MGDPIGPEPFCIETHDGDPRDSHHHGLDGECRQLVEEDSHRLDGALLLQGADELEQGSVKLCRVGVGPLEVCHHPILHRLRRVRVGRRPS